MRKVTKEHEGNTKSLNKNYKKVCETGNRRIENKIHHSKDNGGHPGSQELKDSIERLRIFF